jgi:hypothetical protein
MQKDWLFGNDGYSPKIYHIGEIELGFVIKITKKVDKVKSQKT